MSELMNHVEFRRRLRTRSKGKSANKAPFSIAWASGKLSRAHSANGRKITTIMSDPSRTIWPISTRGCRSVPPRPRISCSPTRTRKSGGDRHTDLLIRFAEACGTTRARVIDPENMTATTRGLQSWCYAVAMREDQSSRSPASWSAWSRRCPRSIASKRRRCARSTSSPTRSRILRSPHRVRRDPRRARLPDRARARQYRGTATALPQDLRNRRPDAAAVYHRAVLGLRRQGYSDQRNRERRAQVQHGERQLLQA